MTTMPSRDYSRPPSGRLPALVAACYWPLTPAECHELTQHFDGDRHAFPFETFSQRVRVRLKNVDGPPLTARPIHVYFRVDPDRLGVRVRLTQHEWAAWLRAVANGPGAHS